MAFCENPAQLGGIFFIRTYQQNRNKPTHYNKNITNSYLALQGVKNIL